MGTTTDDAACGASNLEPVLPLGANSERLLLTTAGILCVAAALKVAELAGLSPIGGLLALLEFLLAVALVQDRHRRRAWTLAVLVFSVFSAVAAGKVIAGATDCGCFGVVAVHPAWTLALDLTVLAGLWATCPFDPLRHRIRPLAIGVLGGLAVGSATLATAHALASNKTIIPEQWLGQRLPVLDQIDIGPQLAVGGWTLLFVRQGCPACDEQLTTLLDTHDDSFVWDSDELLDHGLRSIAVIEVSGSEIGWLPGSSRLVTGRLVSQDTAMMLPTPLTATLEDGVVQRISSRSNERLFSVGI